MIINLKKSLALGFHHKSNKHIVFPDIILKDTQITYVSELKFLGQWPYYNLNWDCHVEKLINKLNKLFFAVKTIEPFVNKKIVRNHVFCINILHFHFWTKHKFILIQIVALYVCYMFWLILRLSHGLSIQKIL